MGMMLWRHRTEEQEVDPAPEIEEPGNEPEEKNKK